MSRNNPMFFTHKQYHFFLFILFACLYLLYAQPIFKSWFIFDDFSNLAYLKSLPQPLTFNSIIDYLSNSTQSNLLGRPISLLSFIPQHQDWLKTPVYFKLVNLIIHLFNTLLVYKIITLLLPLLNNTLSKKQTLHIALITSAIWCFHPLNVSTVHYIIQRMSLMSGFFSLIAILLYCIYLQRPSKAISIKAAVLTAFTLHCIILIGIFSKENAVLSYPLLMLLALCTAVVTKRKIHSLLNWLLIFIPLLAGIIGFILLYNQLIINGYAGRDFNLTERLLTEARIVFFYIWQIIVPNPSHYGLFHDYFTLSKGIFLPVSTLYAVIAWIAVFISLFIYRNPLWRFAWLWFIISHLLESTIIPLELIFEHRNYIAMLGPLLFFVHFIITLAEKWQKLKPVCYALIPFIFISSGVKVAHTWGNPLKQAEAWYNAHPSERRTTQYAEQLLFNKKYVQAYQLFYKLYEQTNKAGYLWQILSVSCNDKKVKLPTKQQFHTAELTPHSAHKLFLVMKHVLESKLNNQCSITNDYFSNILEELLTQPAYQFNAFYRYTSYFYYSDQQIERSINILETAHKRFPHIVTDIDLLSILLEHNRINHATIELLNSLQASHSIMSNGEQQYFERTLQKYNALIHNISNYSSEK